MQTVILPGHSPQNKEWAEKVAKSLTIDGQIRPIFWDHWLDPKESFNPKEKAILISRHTKGEQINIIAKSIGILVAAYVTQEIPKQINKVILCGIPLNDLSEEEKTELKTELLNLPKDKVVCYQNSNDPHGTCMEVKAFLPEGINVIEKDSTDHEYPYFTDFNAFLTS